MLHVVSFLLGAIVVCSHAFTQDRLQPRPSFLHVASMASSSSADTTTTANATTKEDSNYYELSSGVRMQVMSSLPKRKNSKPPILFLHGSFHGSWCWAERFFPYFVNKGYAVVAPNWRGTAGCFAGEAVRKVKIMEHVADLQAVLAQVLPSILGQNKKMPVVVCHSFGGLALMKYLETHPEQAGELAGIITICSVPPSGNGKMTMRFLRKSWSASYKITVGFAMKKCITNGVLCRQLFFGGDKILRDDGSVEDFGVSDESLSRYQECFRRDSEATIDLLDLAKQLPSSVTTEDGKAPFVDRLPPCLVMGATDDFIVDREGYKETSTYFGLDDYTLVDSPHDVMLGAKWQNAADAVDKWVQENVKV